MGGKSSVTITALVIGKRICINGSGTRGGSAQREVISVSMVTQFEYIIKSFNGTALVWTVM